MLQVIRYFDSLGRNYPPIGSPMAKGFYFGNVIQNKKKFVFVDATDARLSKCYKGGVMVLPAGSAFETSEISKFEQFLQTLSVEIIKTGLEIGVFSEDFGKVVYSFETPDDFIKAVLFTGCLFDGKYISDEKIKFDKTSITFEFRGVPLNFLIMISTKFCNAFGLKELILKCSDDDTIYMVKPSVYSIKSTKNLINYCELETFGLIYNAPFFGFNRYLWAHRFLRLRNWWEERKGGN